MSTGTDVIGVFPRERQWLLPGLQALQEAFGHLSADALAAAAAHLRVPLSEVYGVATGYPEFRLSPRGAHHIRVCTGVSCALLGGRELLELATRRGGSEPDLTVEAADCFFACSVAPMVEMDGRLRGRVTPGDLAGTRREVAPTRHAPSLIYAPPPAAGLPPAAPSARATLAILVEAACARRAARPAVRLLVQTGTCGLAVGAAEVYRRLADVVAAQSVAVEVGESGCNGMCYAQPVVEIQREGWPRALVERVTVEAVPSLVERVLAPGADMTGLGGLAWAATPWRGLAPAATHAFWRHQERVLLARTGLIDPGHLDDALLAGAYQALAEALDGPVEQIVERVKASGLQGRGGAFFPAALKWEACRRAAGTPRYLVVNGEEGEPGIFKDRHLMEGDPHLVLEGALLAAVAAGATRAILYVHGEAHRSAERLARAIAQGAAAGIVGERLLGRPVGCQVEVRRGAGGFVLGEETALLESIEGRRAQPRTRPPFPVESGLWGRPTVINNVETLAAVPAIVARGGAWFAGLGTSSAPGTKVFGLSGAVRRPGVVETRNGVTLRLLLEEVGGGAPDGRPYLGAVVGGPSGTIVPAALADAPMEPRGHVSPGTGGVVAVPSGASIVGIVRSLLRFNANESCGKCTPCREGTPRLLAMLDDLEGGGDTAAVVRGIRELGETIQLASLCGLGQAAPLALLRALDTFGETLAPGPLSRP